MILCSCNIITREELVEIITGFLHDDPWKLITPGRLYQAMEKRGKCCSCFPGVIDIIVETSAAYHRELASPEAEIIDFVARLNAEHQKTAAIKYKARTPKHTNKAQFA